MLPGMDDVAMTVLAVLAVGTEMALVMVVNGAEQKARGQRAEGIARSLGLGVEEGDRLTGTLDGVRVTLRTDKRGGKHKVLWTVARVELLEPLPAGLSVTCETFLHSFADLVGRTDVQLGNALDRQLRITAVDADGARA